VIVNAEIGNGAHRTRVFDPVIKAMPEWYREKLNVHVVDTVAEAMELVRDARKACGMVPAALQPATGQNAAKLPFPPPDTGTDGAGPGLAPA
jgi:hypothetical protein